MATEAYRYHEPHALRREFEVSLTVNTNTARQNLALDNDRTYNMPLPLVIRKIVAVTLIKKKKKKRKKDIRLSGKFCS